MRLLKILFISGNLGAITDAPKDSKLCRLASKPQGYSMGGVFIYRVFTFTTYFEVLMDYTINAILSF